MKLVSLLCGLVLSGCATVHDPKDQYSYLRVNNGVEIISAVITNPAPVCGKPVETVRLDKVPELQVYVDVKGDGKTCKSTRY